MHRIGLIAAAGALSAAAALACGSSRGNSSSDDEDSGHDGGALLPPPSGSEGDARTADVRTPQEEPVVCGVTPCVTQLTSGRAHVCARIDDGTVRCWGSNSRGQLGFGDSDGGLEADAGPAPGRVVGLSNVTQISAAHDTTCATVDDGAVKCWGDNSTAALGYVVGTSGQDTSPHPSPVAVSLPAAASRVDVISALGSWGEACATLRTGEVWCWGFNTGGDDGVGNYGFLARSSLGPTDLLAGPGLADRLGAYGALRFGTSYGPFAITEDGRLIEWGTISGRDTVSNDARAYPVALELTAVTNIAASASHACAITEGQVKCWLHNNFDVYLCTGNDHNGVLPSLARTQSAAAPQQLAVGLSTAGTCVRMSDGSVECCGDNKLGGLATGDELVSKFFTPAKALDGFVVQIVATDTSKCALLKNGLVKCWGGNSNGELGQGTTDTGPHSVPLAVTLP